MHVLKRMGENTHIEELGVIAENPVEFGDYKIRAVPVYEIA